MFEFRLLYIYMYNTIFLSTEINLRELYSHPIVYGEEK
jgi:hypothetical protein